ncbi:hypothetical protein AHAS_Ahas03G0130800 [Arachis hypogaea]
MVRVLRSCIQSILKMVNSFIGMAGIAMILYSAWMIRIWQREMGELPFGSDSKYPPPWFIYTFLFLGVVFCMITCTGHVAAETANGCCLYMYMVFMVILIMLEASLAVDVFLHSDWEKDFPIDPTGNFDQFQKFVKSNFEMCKWVGLSLVALQGLSLLISMILKGLGPHQSYDSDDEYGPDRVPLLKNAPPYAKNEAWLRINDKFGQLVKSFVSSCNNTCRGVEKEETKQNTSTLLGEAIALPFTKGFFPLLSHITFLNHCFFSSEYLRLELDSFSVFVDNLSKDISKRELFHLFKWTGRIIDIYLSRKNKNGQIYLFAFVRHTTKGGALKAAADMNGMMLRGNRVFVGEAKYRRGAASQNARGKEAKDNTREIDKGCNPLNRSVKAAEEKLVRQQHDGNIKDPNKNECTKKVEIHIVNENVVWLQRSIVGDTKLAINFNVLQQKIHNVLPGVTHVRELGAYKGMITFDSVLSAEEAYTFRMNVLLKMFYRVWRWDETERSESRRVWLECFGVPLHAWSTDTFRRIGEQWGDVVKWRRIAEEQLVGIVNNGHKRPEVAWDQVAILISVDNHSVEKEKDRMEAKDSQGSSHINGGADSEETTSCDFNQRNGSQSYVGNCFDPGLGSLAHGPAIAAHPSSSAVGLGSRHRREENHGQPDLAAGEFATVLSWLGVTTQIGGVVGEQPGRVRADGKGSRQSVDEICGLRLALEKAARETEMTRPTGGTGRNGAAMNDTGEGGRWPQGRETHTGPIQEERTCESQDRVRLLEDEGYGNVNGLLMGCKAAEENQLSGGVTGSGPEEGEIVMESEEWVNAREQEEQQTICTQLGTEREATMDGGTDMQNKNQRLSWEEEMTENKEA